MPIYTNADYEPDDDPAPFGIDFKGDEIEVGDEIVEFDGDLIRLEDAQEWLVANATRVNTEE